MTIDIAAAIPATPTKYKRPPSFYDSWQAGEGIPIHKVFHIQLDGGPLPDVEHLLDGNARARLPRVVKRRGTLVLGRRGGDRRGDVDRHALSSGRPNPPGGARRL